MWATPVESAGGVRVINGKQLRSRGLVPPQTGGAVHFVQMLFCKKSESVLVHDES